MFGHATKVKRDIERWVAAGFVDAATASKLTADIDAHHRGVSFGTVLSMMAAALFAAALLLVVAANWEAIPRLVRVGVLFAVILAGYAGGALLKLRGRDGFGEGAWVLAATAFGASIALIAQMYHMTGDEKQAVFVWGLGAALAAAALRSPALTIGAVLLGAVWMLMHVEDGWWWLRNLPYAYPAVVAALYVLSFWTRSAPARHLALLSLMLFAVLHFWEDETLLTSPLLLAAAGTALFAFGHARPVAAERIFGLGAGLEVQALLAFLSGIGLLQGTFIDEPEFLFVSILAFAGIIAVLLLAGRDNTMLRWLAYAAFVFQLCFIYLVMVGSMLGTAGFFVLGGLVLAGLAWLISRLEQRFSEPEPVLPGGGS